MESQPLPLSTTLSFKRSMPRRSGLTMFRKSLKPLSTSALPSCRPDVMVATLPSPLKGGLCSSGDVFTAWCAQGTRLPHRCQTALLRSACSPPICTQFTGDVAPANTIIRPGRPDSQVRTAGLSGRGHADLYASQQTCYHCVGTGQAEAESIFDWLAGFFFNVLLVYFCWGCCY